jgi:hypothetical protein
MNPMPYNEARKYVSHPCINVLIVMTPKRCNSVSLDLGFLEVLRFSKRHRGLKTITPIRWQPDKKCEPLFVVSAMWNITSRR